MNLLDKYVTEVGKHLPSRGRADIEAEIRSTLEDMLEERIQASPEDDASPQGDAAVIALLKEYGSPREVAESYAGPRYLIGPLMYPRLELVAKIVLSALFVGLLVAFGFSVVRGEMTSLEISKALVNFLLNYIGTAIAVLGNIVLVFAVLERVLPKEVISGKDEEWDPEQLAKEAGPDEVRFSEKVFEIIFTIIFLVLFNFYSEYVGLYIFSGDRSYFIPFLTDAFFTYLPWWTLLGIAQIGLNFFLLRNRMWTRVTRFISLTLTVATLILVAIVLLGPPIINISPEALAQLPFDLSTENADRISHFVTIPILLAILIATSIEGVQTIMRLIRRGYPAPFELQK